MIKRFEPQKLDLFVLFEMFEFEFDLSFSLNFELFLKVRGIRGLKDFDNPPQL